jgi:hypothetical protein
MATCPTAWLLFLVSAGALAQQPVWTGHYDLERTGANVHETVLTPKNVNRSTFGSLGQMQVSGCVIAQPLYVPQVDIPGRGKRNVVYVATTAAILYAFDAELFTRYFERRLGYPVQSNEIAGYNDFPFCDGVDVVGPMGVVGTPVIDVQAGALFVSASTIDPPIHGRIVRRRHVRPALSVTARGIAAGAGPRLCRVRVAHG